MTAEQERAAVVAKRCLSFALGIATCLGGFALAGGMFDFIDGHRSWPAVLMFPVIGLVSTACAVLLLSGLALCVMAIERGEHMRGGE